MKLSEKIADLQNIQKQYGDLECFHCLDDGFVAIDAEPSCVCKVEEYECYTDDENAQKFIGKLVVIV